MLCSLFCGEPYPTPTPAPRRDSDKVLMDHANDAKVTEGSVYHLSG